MQLLLALTAASVGGDKTTCMSNIETTEGIHITCFCDMVKYVDTSLPDANNGNSDDGFSLAKFAYNLSGAYFNKFLHITFQSCRHLSLVMDQSELTRIGSVHFRPDIQVSSIDVEQVYHLDLVRKRPAAAVDDEGAYTKLRVEHRKDVTIDLYAVKLVKIDSGAKFGSLQVESDNGVPTTSVLYIDLNQGQPGDENSLNVTGFQNQNVYFITKKNQKVPLRKNESIQTKMRQLSSSEALESAPQDPSSAADDNEGSSSNALRLELACALTVFALVIAMGIFGLAVVVAHRQKRKRQLKALLRAKNLGPFLSSREIAQGIGMKFLHPMTKRTPTTPPSSSPSSPASSTFASSSSISQPPPPLPAKKRQLPASDENGATKKTIDINELLSGILYRSRKGDFNASSAAVGAIRKGGAGGEATAEAINGNSNSTKNQLQSSSCREDDAAVVSVGGSGSSATSSRRCEHKRMRSRRQSREAGRESKDEFEDDDKSYVSQISQQVFVVPGGAAAGPADRSASRMGSRRSTKSHGRASSGGATAAATDVGEMNFFSSVSSRRSRQKPRRPPVMNNDDDDGDDDEEYDPDPAPAGDTRL